MPYAIIRTAKLTKMANISGSASHNFRERQTLNADSERTPNNLTVGAQSSKEVIAAVKARLETVPTVRKNAVLAIEYFIGASPEFFKDATIEQQKGYFDQAEKWLIQRHGQQNVVAITRQYDETSPHICAYVVPIDFNGKLNCSHFLDGRTKLIGMQTNFADVCGRQFGLQRGVEGSKAKHITLKNYYAQIQAETPQLLAGASREEFREAFEIKIAKAKQYDIEKANKAATEALLVELRESAVQVRILPLDAVLERLGCIPDPQDKKNWRTPIGRITVDGAKFYAHGLGKGGGGAIDLVMLVEDIKFIDAVKLLSDHFGDAAVISHGAAIFEKTIEDADSMPKKPFQLPEPKLENWPRVRKYLTETRCLSEKIVDKFNAAGEIYADKYSNAVFVLSRGVGAELRGTGEKPFHGVKGMKMPFFIAGSDATKMAFVESSIDAISLYELGFKGNIASMSGNSTATSKEFADTNREKGITIIAAFDNDRAGEQMAANLGQPTTRLCPKSKDWNDDLKTKREEAKMAQTPAPTVEDYKLAEAIALRRRADPKSQPTSNELAAINRIIVQQARDRLKQSQWTTKIDRPRGPSI